jgi:hypothetical protein
MRIETYLSDRKRRQAEANTRTLIKLGFIAALIVIAGGALILAASLLDVSGIQQPIRSAPPSRPLAAVLFIVAGVAVALVRPFAVPLAARLLLALVIVVAGARILISFIAPSVVDPSVLSDAMGIGWHAAVMFILVSSAFLLRAWGYARSSR